MLVVSSDLELDYHSLSLNIYFTVKSNETFVTKLFKTFVCTNQQMSFLDQF